MTETDCASFCVGYRPPDVVSIQSPTVVARVTEHSSDQIAVSVVTVEEQLSGWYAQLRQAKTAEKRAWAYRRLAENVRFLADIPILDFNEAAILRYEALKRQRLKVRKMDLQIAATALENCGTVATRNVSDFKAVPGLDVVDWSK